MCVCVREYAYLCVCHAKGFLGIGRRFSHSPLSYPQLKGFRNIYALGECATMDQKKILHRTLDIFKALDENGDGVIDVRNCLPPSLLLSLLRRSFG